MDIEQSQRKDIDISLNDRLSLEIDEENVTYSPYSVDITNKSVGNNWIFSDDVISKTNMAEDDTVEFHIDSIPSLQHKNITGISIGFDYVVENQLPRSPVLTNIFFTSLDVTQHVSAEITLNDSGHVDKDCSLFGFDSNVLNNTIVDEGFAIGFNFDGNKSNASVSISNVMLSLEFRDILSDEIDTVVNRLNPAVDFWRDGDKLFLQIGDGTGKGRVEQGEIDTYSKEEIDNKLNTKVDTVIGKELSSNDYTTTEKNKLEGIEAHANNYTHPAYHSSGIIREESALTNISTEQNATQHEINMAIDSHMFSGDYDDLVNKPTIPERISDLTNDSDFIETSATAGLVKNDGTIDTTQYLSTLPSHNHDDRYYTESEVDDALDDKQDVLVSGTNIKTINSESLLGSGNIVIQGGGTGVDIATSWSDPTSDSKVPSEKLAKDSLDGKADSVHSHGGITSDGKWNGTGGRGFLIVDNTTKDILAVQYVNATVVRDTQTFTNITPSIDTQKGINTAIDTALNNIPSNADIIDLIYPVGSIYMSVNSTDPSTIFGGTWERLKDKFLLASGDTYTNGATGGSATVSLTESEMPRHTHIQNSHNHTQNKHHHTQYSYYSTGTGTSGAYVQSSNRKTTRVNTDDTTATNIETTATNKYTGGSGTSQSASNGSAHENMPPYLAVYMWKRIT